MKAFLSMVRADLKMTLRDRTHLFWLLLLPAVLIVVLGVLAILEWELPLYVGAGIGTQGPRDGNMNYVDFLVPGVLAMGIMNGGIVGLSAVFVMMCERGVLRRIKATPFPLTNFITARVAAQFLVGLCQAAVLLGLAKLSFNLDIAGNLLDVAVFVFLGSLAFFTIGLFVAGVSRKQESATALAQLVSLPMVLVSGVFIPLDRLPTWLQDVAMALPLTYLADGLRQVMAYGASLANLRGDLLALILTSAVGFFLAVHFTRRAE